MSPVLDSLIRVAEERADHPAIIFEGQTLTYAELLENVLRRAAWLQGSGVSTGDRIAVLALNHPTFIETFFACARLEAIFVPLNTRLNAPEIAFQIDHCTPILGLADVALLDTLSAAAPNLTIASIEADAVRAVDPLGADSRVEGGAPLTIVYTSGTTGEPKGAVHTHASIAATIDHGVTAHDLTSTDRGLEFLPLFHVGGLNIQTLPLLSVGATVILHRAFDPTTTFDDIEAHRPTISLVVPAIMQALIAHPRWTTTDFTSLRGAMAGSSIVPTDLLEAFNAAGVATGQVYGSTETGPTSVVLQFEHSDRVGCVGQAVLGSEYRVVDSEGQPTEIGEVHVRGAHVFSHYWNDAPATDAVFDGDWYRTGDIGRDDEGWLTILDRLGDMIISGGENIYPAELEAALTEAPGVAELTIVGRPDDRWGETPVAVVVAQPGEQPTLEGIRSFGEVRLSRYKLPTRLELVDSLPRTALGKVRKHEL